MIQSVENISLALRSLYRSCGYMRYKMSKFEEYDFYVRNKDFLVSDSVITFTDTTGKLMALKPDVTLSIVKNTRDVPGCVQKVYYNENVYRVSGSARSFREIVQLGLECIGDIDDYSIFEVLSLAAKSLQTISEDSVLSISHLGLLSDILCDLPQEKRASILSLIRDKNAHELEKACTDASIDDRYRLLSALIECSGSPAQVLPRLEALLGKTPAVCQLKRLTSAFEGTALARILRIDLSVINDINYYNGIVFKGFVEGVPQSVLSGGQYDLLMQKMQRRSGAIGFAVYTDLLERLHPSSREYDADTVLLYDANADVKDVAAAVSALQKDGRRVIAQRSVPDKLRYRQLMRIEKGEVKIVENA